jgi:predicted RNase H-like HicB family nuclease
MKQNKRDLNYYMSLKYKIEIEAIAPEDGGGWEAFIPQLGRLTMTGAGETPEEALQCLEEVKETIFTMCLEEGTPIPEPERSSESFSGRILFRTTRDMHRELVYTAKQQNVSLNTYLKQVVDLGHSLDCFKKGLNNTTQEWFNEHRTHDLNLDCKLPKIIVTDFELPEWDPNPPFNLVKEAMPHKEVKGEAMDRKTVAKAGSSSEAFSSFIQGMELKNIWLHKMSSELHVRPFKLPSTLGMSISYAEKFRNLDDGIAEVSTVYSLEAADKEGNRIASMEFDILSRYNLSIPFDDNLFKVFKDNVLPSQVWPYLRELTQNTIIRMGLPPLTLPLWKSPQIRDSAKKAAKKATRKTTPKKATKAKKKA